VSRVLAYERVRASTLKSTFLFPLIGAAIAWAASILFLVLGSDSDQVSVATFIGQAFTPLSAVFLTVPFAQAFGHEYRDGTIRLALTEYPRRTGLFFAKLLVPAIIAFIAALITVGGIALIAVLGPSFGYPAVTGIDAIGFISLREALFVVLWGLLVAAITCITRNMSAGIAGVLIWGLIAENLIAAFLIDRFPIIGDILPVGQGFGWVQTGDVSLIIPMLVTVGLFTVVAYARFVRSDA
jgi:ABC-type transport system involved in multi-copper enzyme maturation permease subunit